MESKEIVLYIATSNEACYPEHGLGNVRGIYRTEEEAIDRIICRTEEYKGLYKLTVPAHGKPELVTVKRWKTVSDDILF